MPLETIDSAAVAGVTMSDRSSVTPACPPHHWEITTVRMDGSAFYHHHCLRCEAQKDVPVGLALQPKTWRMSGSKAVQQQDPPSS